MYSLKIRVTGKSPYRKPYDVNRSVLSPQHNVGIDAKVVVVGQAEVIRSLKVPGEKERTGKGVIQETLKLDGKAPVESIRKVVEKAELGQDGKGGRNDDGNIALTYRGMIQNKVVRKQLANFNCKQSEQVIIT